MVHRVYVGFGFMGYGVCIGFRFIGFWCIRYYTITVSMVWCIGYYTITRLLYYTPK